MASEGPRRLCRQARRACLHGRRAGKYDGVYLPSYTIYTFAIIYPFVIPFVIYPRCLFISDDLVSSSSTGSKMTTYDDDGDDDDNDGDDDVNRCDRR